MGEKGKLRFIGVLPPPIILKKAPFFILGVILVKVPFVTNTSLGEAGFAPEVSQLRPVRTRPAIAI
jgi:hypothetical protein